jgi:diguanylate cyclase (GGDEF)-like protein
VVTVIRRAEQRDLRQRQRQHSLGTLADLGRPGVPGALAGWLCLRLVEGRRRLRRANAKLADLASKDALSGLSNRRHLTEQLLPLLANVRRHNFPLCVLMIDIDHFKTMNDTFGHQAGDTAIRHVAQNLAGALREGDLLARWGGEEFLAVLPGTTLGEAMQAAERLRRRVESTPVQLGEVEGRSLVAMAVSIGVAEASDDSLDELVHRADLGLYEAKSAGRNSVRVLELGTRA